MTRPADVVDPNELMPERVDLGDPASVKERDKALKLLAEQQGNDIREVMGTMQGRRFLWRLLSECNIFAACETAFDEGARRKGLWLLDEIERTDCALFIEMWKENLQKRKGVMK
jgi:hypothetical protein